MADANLNPTANPLPPTPPMGNIGNVQAGGIPQAISFGANIPTPAAAPQAGVGAPMMPPATGVNPNLALANNTGGDTNFVIIGYIAPQKNAHKPAINEKLARKYYAELYEAYKSDASNDINKTASVLDANGTPVVDSENQEKKITLSKTYTLKSYRTFFRDGEKGFEALNAQETYNVDMSEERIEYFILKNLRADMAASDNSKSVQALSEAHTKDVSTGVGIFKLSQLYKLCYSIDKQKLPVVTVVLDDKGNKHHEPIGYMYLAASKSRNPKTQPKLSLVFTTAQVTKVKIRELRSSSGQGLAYAVRTDMTVDTKKQITKEMINNYETFCERFPEQANSILTLRTRKRITKEQFGGNDTAYKAAKTAEIIPYDLQAAVLSLLDVSRVMYDELGKTKGTKKSLSMDTIQNYAREAKRILQAKYGGHQ